MDLENIYKEMVQNNIEWLQNNSFISDTELTVPYQDTRRCLAFVGNGILKYSNEWINIQHILDTVDGNKWMRPRIHHSFISIHPWVEDTSKIIFNSTEMIGNILQEHLSGGYTIIFDRIIPVKTGFVLCGTCDKDINIIREHLRSLGLVKGERYKLDIAHMTLLRNTKQVSFEEQERIIDMFCSVPKTPYACLTVKSLDCVVSSWSMIDGTYSTYETFSL